MYLVSSFKYLTALGLTIGTVKNYPNPVKDFTTFLIDHNQPGSDIEVTIRIFDQQGKLVHQIFDRIMRIVRLL